MNKTTKNVTARGLKECSKNYTSMNDELLAQSKKLKGQSPALIPIRTYVFQGATAPLHIGPLSIKWSTPDHL